MTGTMTRDAIYFHIFLGSRGILFQPQLCNALVNTGLRIELENEVIALHNARKVSVKENSKFQRLNFGPKQGSQALSRTIVLTDNMSLYDTAHTTLTPK